jgi:ribosomal protein L17
MTKADELRQHAEEAIGLARKAKSKKDKAALIEIARVWAIAATYREVRGEKAA